MRLKWVGQCGVTVGLLLVSTGGNAQTLGRELAQANDLGCRRVNVRTGVYTQPNLSSVSQGVLAQSQLVRLESAARGWARVTQPLIGWVEARHLSPPIACDARITSSLERPPRPSVFPLPGSSAPPLAVAKPGATAATVICRVTSPNGLAIRREPSLEDGLFITSLAPGDHAFRFTGQTARTQNSLGTLTWLYITAPQTGWITAGYMGQPPTITGDRCG